jgi:hypothetical protein
MYGTRVRVTHNSALKSRVCNVETGEVGEIAQGSEKLGERVRTLVQRLLVVIGLGEINLVDHERWGCLARSDVVL